MPENHLQKAGQNVELALGDLPAMFMKLLRAGIETGPNARIVATWCTQNPVAAAKVVGEIAFAAALAQLAREGHHG